MHFIQVGLGIAPAGERETAKHGEQARGKDNFVGCAQHFLAQIPEKIKMPRPGPKRRLLHDAIYIAKTQIVLRGDVQILRAMLDKLWRCPVPPLTWPSMAAAPSGEITE